MKRFLTALLLCVAASVAAQNRIPTVNIVGTNPSGTSCSATNALEQYNGAFYVCSGGTYTMLGATDTSALHTSGGTIGSTALIASPASGSDLGQQIINQDSALSGSPATLEVTTSGNISEVVTLSTGHDLTCASKNITLTLANNTAQIVQSTNTHIRNCTIATTRTAVLPSITASGVTKVGVDGVVFSGGGPWVSYTSVSEFAVDDVLGTSLTAPTGNGILVTSSTNGHIKGTHAYGFVVPTNSGTGRLIHVLNSSYVAVSDSVIHDIDGSTQSSYAGVSFEGSSSCTDTGDIITRMMNGDGVVVEGWSSDIAITGVTGSYENEVGVTPAGPNANTGSGLDVFNATNVHVTNSTFNNNGPTSSAQPGAWIWGSSHVTIEGGSINGNTDNGIFLSGSPYTKLLGVKVDSNTFDGLYATQTTGTCNTSGTSVTIVTGGPVGSLSAGTPIIINGTTYYLASATSSPGTSVTLTTSAGAQSGVTWSVDNNTLQIIGGEYNNNNAGNTATTYYQNGITLGNSASGEIIGITATDTRPTKLQVNGIQINNSARVVMIGNNTAGNSGAGVNDGVGKSANLSDDGSTPALTSTGAFGVGLFSSNPASPANGQLWYNTTVPGLYAEIGGNAVGLTTQSQWGINVAHWGTNDLNLDTLYTQGWYASYTFLGTTPIGSSTYLCAVRPVGPLVGAPQTETIQECSVLNSVAPTYKRASSGTGTWSTWQLENTYTGTCTMTAGACSAQNLPVLFISAPACWGSFTGTGTLTGILKFPSSAGSPGTVTPTSTVNTDTAQVRYFCTGAPN